jgi:hypothetical protein
MTNSNGMNRQRKHADLKVLVAQLGQRMYYAVPNIFEEAGILSRLYKDLYIKDKNIKYLLDTIPSRWTKTIASRQSRVLPNRIVSFQKFGLQYIWRLRRCKTAGDQLQTFVWAGETFNRLILKEGFDSTNIVYAFRSAARELFIEAKNKGIKTCLEQVIAPKMVEAHILAEEYESWPDWESKSEFTSVEMFSNSERGMGTF